MCFIWIFLYFPKCFIRKLEWLLKNNYLPERFPRNMSKIIWKHTNMFVIYSGRLDYKRWIRPWNRHRCPFCTLPLTIIGCKIAKSAVGSSNIWFSKMCISVWNVARISYKHAIKYLKFDIAKHFLRTHFFYFLELRNIAFVARYP